MKQADIDKMLFEADADGDNAKLLEAINLGAKIHANNYYALYISATNNHKETVALLLDLSAHIYASNYEAFRDAANMGCIETVALMEGALHYD